MKMEEKEFNFIEKEENALMRFCKNNQEAKDRLNTIINWRKEFIKKRLFDATMLLGMFNAGTLTSIDLREHRQRIKDEAGENLI